MIIANCLAPNATDVTKCSQCDTGYQFLSSCGISDYKSLTS